MNIAIEYQYHTPTRLHISPRKPALKHQLFLPMSGLVLIRIGRLDYAIEPGQAFWVPQSCLHSVTLLPNTQLHQVSFSVRLLDAFPQQAGFFTPSPLLSALLDRAQQLQQRFDDAHRDTAFNDLLNVIKNEATLFCPQLNSTALSTIIQNWQHLAPSSSVELSSDTEPYWPTEISDKDGVERLLLAVRVREAKRQQLSGLKESQIKGALFPEHAQSLQEILSPWFD
ncbi:MULTISPECIES: AraC family ligand binding domain-containing protein [unclassified Vibrio]|uniref:AraC family ligand binding domain-containing protein n=1 Tax=Vibrio sp. HB236076 TaxID=3232307 RepID=A0AB39HKB0_9VIBR|nr:AraC family ligand binding domain-containing protein [Vibrio sp. HB161653]MDP5252655.1 AraC family ligand binding domain-containing protein [Vibrio sp. HB161653]